MKLYELAANYNAVLEMMESDESIALTDTLEAIEDQIEDKAENIAKLIKNMDAEAKAIKDEESRLADRRKSIENRVTGLKTYLQGQLEVAGLDKVKRPTLTVSIQNNPPSVKVIDEKLLIPYMVQQEPKLDKKTLLSDLKEGKQVAGAEIQQTRGLRIR
ncbi:siphovirus Gp157 family protein [Metabacillus fastidiosus]|uniref:Siphovirus Gp157 family protein n=1 Tax=Metabacillus fastidiosus TaxID=1458 RepID=A0ABU6NRQ6_9BACI|nr:siphovirus Gp157 family protein [Metabacillus fastidiosus]